MLLRNELPLNPNFQFPLSVVSIEMSSDLRIAYVYVNTHENLEKDEIINRLESCRKYLSKEVNQFISLKFVPKLIFRYDLTIEKYDQISKLLETKKVKSDLNKMKTNNYSGWIFIDKPEGKTSFDVIRKIKKILKIKKIGHSGTLDPIASGILGIGIGEATKSIPFFF